MAIPNVVTETVISSAWGNTVADAINGLVEIGTWTPTLENITIGAGSNTATYYFVGGTEVGEFGIIHVHGVIAFGVGGSVAAGTGQRIWLHPNFNFAQVGSDRIIAHGMHRGPASYLLQGWIQTATSWRPLYVTAVPTLASINNTTPFTWGTNHVMTYVYTAPVVRV